MNVTVLADALAPVLRELVESAVAPVLVRLTETEKVLADAQAALAARPDVEAVVAAAVAKALADQPKVEPLDPDAIKSMIMEAVAAIPPATPGKDADPDVLRAAVAAEVERAAAALPKAPTAEEVAALIPPPESGKSVTVDDVRPILDAAVAGAFATMRVPEDGKDVDPEIVRAIVKEAVATLPAHPTAEEIAALLPAPKDGKDADPEAVAAIVAAAVAQLPPPPAGKDADPEVIRTMVSEAVAALPPPAIAEALKDHTGELVLTLLDGRVIKTGIRDGAPGRDGLGFDDLEVVEDATTLTLRLARGEHVKEWTLAKPTLADCFKYGWKEGEDYARGSVVMWAGQPWLAMADTKAKPETNADWTMLAKKARDGQDLRPIDPKATTPVKLK